MLFLFKLFLYINSTLVWRKKLIKVVIVFLMIMLRLLLKGCVSNIEMFAFETESVLNKNQNKQFWRNVKKFENWKLWNFFYRIQNDFRQLQRNYRGKWHRHFVHQFQHNARPYCDSDKGQQKRWRKWTHLPMFIWRTHSQRFDRKTIWNSSSTI